MDSLAERLYGEAKLLADHIATVESPSAVEVLLRRFDAEQERRAEEDRQRWQRERAELTEFLRAERAALPDGRGWTKYRPFFNVTERGGAMKCGNSRGKRQCNRPSEYVSYCALGRTVLCQECYDK